MLLEYFGRLAVAFGLLGGVFSVEDADAQTGLYAHWSLNKTRYISGEPIVPVGFLKNYSDTAVRYWWDELARYTLVDLSLGEPLPRRTINIPLYIDKPAPTVLSAGDSSDLFLPPILSYFGEGTYRGEHYLKPGQYAFYLDGVSSDTVIFTVEQPSKQVDVDAWIVLKEALDNSRSELVPAEKRFQFYKSFISRFDGSAYIPMALENISRLPPGHVSALSEVERHDFIIRLLRDYPDSHYSARAVRYIRPSELTGDQRSELRTALRMLLEEIEASEGTISLVRSIIDEIAAEQMGE